MIYAKGPPTLVSPVLPLEACLTQHKMLRCTPYLLFHKSCFTWLFREHLFHATWITSAMVRHQARHLWASPLWVLAPSSSTWLSQRGALPCMHACMHARELENASTSPRHSEVSPDVAKVLACVITPGPWAGRRLRTYNISRCASDCFSLSVLPMKDFNSALLTGESDDMLLIGRCAFAWN